MANTVKDLRDYFNTPDAPLGLKEFKEYWDSMSDSDKDYHRNVDLNTGLLPAS